jgi:hypothetical protein
MDKGNWIPMDKSLTAALPVKRPYTLIEAVFSYQVDMDNGTIRGFRDYARIWGWSLNKAIGFIRDKQGTKTEQARDTHGTVKFRFINPLQGCKVQAKDKQGTKSGHARDTTIYPNPILNTSSLSEAFRLSELLASLILKNNPNHRYLSNGRYTERVKRWAKDISKLIHTDKQPVEEIEAVIRWCQHDSFWSANILSGEKFRKQYDQLVIKSKNVKQQEYRQGERLADKYPVL